MLGLIDKLLLEHVGLPNVLDFAVHLVNFFGWISQGGQSEPLLFFAHFYQSTPSCLKVRGGGVVGWGGVVAHVIIVSAQSKELGFGDFQTLSGLLGQDLGLLGWGTQTWTWP